MPSALQRDQAKNEKSKEAMKIHRELQMKDAVSEAGNQQQNPVEVHAVRWLKSNATALMDRSNAPDNAWFDAFGHLALVNNTLAKEQLGWKTPMQKQHGHTPDMSPWLHCHFWQPVHCLDLEQTFPDSGERPGHFVGASENIGDALTFEARDPVTDHKVAKSVVLPANNPGIPNHRVTFENTISKERDKLIVDGHHAPSEEKPEECLPDTPEDHTLENRCVNPIERLHAECPKAKVRQNAQCRSQRHSEGPKEGDPFALNDGEEEVAEDPGELSPPQTDEVSANLEKGGILNLREQPEAGKPFPCPRVPGPFGNVQWLPLSLFMGSSHGFIFQSNGMNEFAPHPHNKMVLLCVAQFTSWLAIESFHP